MSGKGHVHRIEPIAWTLPGSEWSPAVLLGCTHGVCSKTESVMPRKRDRRVPKGLTRAQFGALKSGKYWPEIVNGK